VHYPYPDIYEALGLQYAVVDGKEPRMVNSLTIGLEMGDAPMTVCTRGSQVLFLFGDRQFWFTPREIKELALFLVQFGVHPSEAIRPEK